jgi:aryl sulfotransferase
VNEPALVRYRGRVYDSARWQGFVFRADDIVITTPPKCGTTWTQMICALLILQRTTFDRPLGEISPWIDMQTRSRAEMIADLDAQTHRRFIKTHTPLDGLPWDDRVTYICVARDPRDVALSSANHNVNMDMDAFAAAVEKAGDALGPPPAAATAEPDAEMSDHDRFFAWVDNDSAPTELGSSLLRTLRHVESFWDVRDRPNVIMLHYDDLKADLGGQMRALAQRLGIDVPEALWPQLIEAATFENMRANADAVAPETSAALWHDNQRFFNKGISGQWRELLDDDDLRRYDARVAELVDPEFAAWIHHRQPSSM